MSEQTKDVKLNKDGLVPGQLVDYDTMRKIQLKHPKAELVKPETKTPKTAN